MWKEGRVIYTLVCKQHYTEAHETAGNTHRFSTSATPMSGVVMVVGSKRSLRCGSGLTGTRSKLM